MKSNAAGRSVPDLSSRGLQPFGGIGQPPMRDEQKSRKIRSCADYPSDGNKQVATLKSALAKAGLSNGMTVSTHHHLRNGDRIAIQLFSAAKELGVKDLVWYPSAVFPCHAELIPFLNDGTIHHIQGSLNGPLGEYASFGNMRDLAVLRSHGCRYRSLQDGDMSVDVAVIAAPSCDQFGNMTGAIGPSACGGLGFAVADAEYADHVIAVTDNLVEFPCAPWQISGNYVDQVVVVDSIGDASQIVSGTTVPTNSPERQLIARNAAQFVLETEILKPGWSFQAGAGGISLSFTIFVQQIMQEREIFAQFARGGSSQYLVEMLESGLVKTILDGQTFDLEGVRSIRENPNHVMTTPFTSYNYHTKGNFASILDCTVLGATEVDLNFNANVVTHSDGQMLHGIGGWQDALFSKCTILAIPTIRNRVPIIRDELTTFCGPGELIDVVVTERGIAINPLRQDLLEKVEGSNLPIKPLAALKADAERLAGGAAERAVPEEDLVGIVTWVDGTVLDVIHKVRKQK